MPSPKGRHLYSQSEHRQVHCLRVNLVQHADLRTPEMADKEIVKCMYIDEPEILDAAIAKLPPELAKEYTLVKSAPFYLEIVKRLSTKGLCLFCIWLKTWQGADHGNWRWRAAPC